MIVDVSCDDGTTQIARIVHETGDTYSVQFLEKNKHHMFDFSNIVEVVHKETVSGFYDTADLEQTDLYAKGPNGYELIDDSEDEDYCTDSDSNSDSESVSLVDEDEEE